MVSEIEESPRKGTSFKTELSFAKRQNETSSFLTAYEEDYDRE